MQIRLMKQQQSPKYVLVDYRPELVEILARRKVPFVRLGGCCVISLVCISEEVVIHLLGEITRLTKSFPRTSGVGLVYP